MLQGLTPKDADDLFFEKIKLKPDLFFESQNELSLKELSKTTIHGEVEKTENTGFGKEADHQMSNSWAQNAHYSDFIWTAFSKKGSRTLSHNAKKQLKKVAFSAKARWYSKWDPIETVMRKVRSYQVLWANRSFRPLRSQKIRTIKATTMLMC